MPEDDNQQRKVDTHRIGKDYLLQLTSSLWLEDVLFYIFDCTSGYACFGMVVNLSCLVYGKNTKALGNQGFRIQYVNQHI